MFRSHTLKTLALVVWIVLLAVPLAHGEDHIDSARVERLPQLATDGPGTGRGIVFDKRATLRLKIVSAETSSLEDVLGISSPISQVFTPNAAGCVGCSWDVGPFEMGSEIVLYLDNENPETGPEQVDMHPKIYKISDALWSVEFEDWHDGDYDDIVCRAEMLPDTTLAITSISLDGGITLGGIPPGPIWEGEFDEAGNMTSSSPPLPSAADMKGSFWTPGGSTDMSVTLEGYPELPPAAFGIICRYSFQPQTPGCDPAQGEATFAPWLPAPIRIPQKVGRYTLNLGFDIICVSPPQLVRQQYVSDIPFYVTYKEPELPYPETYDTVFYGRATEWASGKSDELSIVESVNWSIYTYGVNQGWNYRLPQEGWDSLILGIKNQGNCADFSNVWHKMTMLLGIKTETRRQFGSEGVGFVTTTGGISMDNLTGNCGQCAQPVDPDRWFFAAHQVGKYGSNYFDPTLGKEYASATEYVDWNIMSVHAGYLLDDADHSIVYLEAPAADYPWGLWCYEDVIYSSFTAPPPANARSYNSTSGPPLTDASGDAAFSGVYSDIGTDDNEDGYFECLTMTAEVDVSVAGEYTVSGGALCPG